LKNIVSDPALLNEFKEKVNQWIADNTSKTTGETVRIEELTCLTEYPLFSLTYKVLTETRSFQEFTRADQTSLENPRASFEKKDADIWKYQVNQPPEFTNFRDTAELAESLTTKKCGVCQGKGVLVCSDCYGQALINCIECRGDGKKICPVCRRAGKKDCGVCSGRGRVLQESTQSYEPCPSCHGSGSLECEECVKGYVKCGACDGKGKLPCVRCAGKGEVECTKCSGKGQFVSGLAMEAVFRPYDEKAELPNGGIPGPVLLELRSKACVDRKYSFDADPIGPAMRAAGLPEEVEKVFQATKLDEKTFQGPSRIIKKNLAVESRHFFNASFSLGGKAMDFWAVKTENGLACQSKLISDLYSFSVSDIDGLISAGRLAEAAKLVSKIIKISHLSKDGSRLRGRISKKIFIDYCVGAFAGAVLFSIGMAPLLFSRWHRSFHFAELLASSLALSVVAGLCCALLFYFFFSIRIITKGLRVSAALAATALALGLVYTALAFAGFEPAAALDAKQMQREYAAYFPFGLPTLANEQDIKFLKGLVAKYAPTGVDLTREGGELKWLIEKQLKDRRDIKKIDDTIHKMGSAPPRKKKIAAKMRGGRIIVR
jgi:hypothetical protein